jgi:hypothetical protein
MLLFLLCEILSVFFVRQKIELYII